LGGQGTSDLPEYRRCKKAPSFTLGAGEAEDAKKDAEAEAARKAGSSNRALHGRGGSRPPAFFKLPGFLSITKRRAATA